MAEKEAMEPSPCPTLHLGLLRGCHPASGSKHCSFLDGKQGPTGTLEDLCPRPEDLPGTPPPTSGCGEGGDQPSHHSQLLGWPCIHDPPHPRSLFHQLLCLEIKTDQLGKAPYGQLKASIGHWSPRCPSHVWARKAAVVTTGPWCQPSPCTCW